VKFNACPATWPAVARIAMLVLTADSNIRKVTVNELFGIGQSIISI